MTTNERTTAKRSDLDATRPPIIVARMGNDTTDLLRKQDWRAITKRAVAYATRLLGKNRQEDAKEVVQSAILDIFQNRRWDPANDPSVETLLARTIFGMTSNLRRRHRNRFEIAIDTVTTLDRNASIATGGDVDVVIDQRRHAVEFDRRLRARLEGDETALGVVALLKEGEETSEEMATASGRDVAAIRKARERVRYHAETVSNAIAQEIEDAENGGGES